MHQVARDALTKQLREATTPEQRDELLSTWADWQFRATEWDADQWRLLEDRGIVAAANAVRERAKQDGSRVPEHWFVS